ncbi:conserved hypothetical protein [Ricinus communis]|uniref:Uncharacterized protein n=1 Tax=Ricinus communis TaxID=3988 RepID=B9RKZ5_RICCO|nr:conserved hypothetical protein [Ricinus communis]
MDKFCQIPKLNCKLKSLIPNYLFAILKGLLVVQEGKVGLLSVSFGGGPLCSLISMADVTIELVIHHSGSFIKEGVIKYIGGEARLMETALDVDHLSFPNIMSYVKDLGYKEIGGLFYKEQGGGEFIVIIDDAPLMCINNVFKTRDMLEFYINHNTCEGSDARASRNRQPFIQVLNRNSEGAIPTTGGVDDYSDEDESILVFSTHQTFDEICVNMSCMTNDEDNELQAARDKVREYKYRYKPKKNRDVGKAEGVSLPIDIISNGEEVVDDDELHDLNEESDGNENVYYNSSDLGSFYEEYGMTFKNMTEVREAIARYTILKGLIVHYKKNDGNRVRAVCKEGCQWVLLVSPHNATNTLTMKTYNRHQ